MVKHFSDKTFLALFYKLFTVAAEKFFKQKNVILCNNFKTEIL